MVYMKKFQLCLFVVCSIMVFNSMVVSSHSNSRKENEVINDLNEKIGIFVFKAIFFSLFINLILF